MLGARGDSRLEGQWCGREGRVERVVVCEEKREDGWVCAADGFDVKGEADAKVCVRVRVSVMAVSQANRAELTPLIES